MWQGAHMRMTLASLVVGLGVVITIAAGAALYNWGVVADETGISGWNPVLWILLFGGVATAWLGRFRSRSRPGTLEPDSSKPTIAGSLWPGHPFQIGGVRLATVVRASIDRLRTPA